MRSPPSSRPRLSMPIKSPRNERAAILRQSSSHAEAAKGVFPHSVEKPRSIRVRRSSGKSMPRLRGCMTRSALRRPSNPNNGTYLRRAHHGRAGRGIHGFGAGHKFPDLMGISTPTMRMGLYRNPPSLQRLSEEVVLAANTLESDATQLPLRPTVDNVKYPHFRAK